MNPVNLIKMFLIQIYSEVHVGKHLSEMWPIQKGLKQEDALLPLLLNFALRYTVGKVQERQVRLKLNGAHHFLFRAYDVNLLGDNIKKITEFINLNQHTAHSVSFHHPRKSRYTTSCRIQTSNTTQPLCTMTRLHVSQETQSTN
jgi:hypothetical protein